MCSSQHETSISWNDYFSITRCDKKNLTYMYKDFYYRNVNDKYTSQKIARLNVEERHVVF